MAPFLTISQAVKLLTDQQVVAIPTETVYGLAANIFSETALAQVFALKQRPTTNPLIVHLKGPEDLAKVAAVIPPKALILAAAFWPGPLTLVLPKMPVISPLITANGPTVGVRVPAHPVALALLKNLDFPLAAPSANLANYLSPTCAEDVALAFPQMAKAILDGGRCQRGIESTVVGFTGEQLTGPVQIYRHGAITKEQLAQILQEPVLEAANHQAIAVSPGMMLKHYSPRLPISICHNVSEALEQLPGRPQVAVLSFQQHYQHPLIVEQIVLSPQGNLEEAAFHFFAALHTLDRAPADCIVAELFPAVGLGKALNDRLVRAATK